MTTSLRERLPLEFGGNLRGLAALLVAAACLFWSFSHPDGPQDPTPADFAPAPAQLAAAPPLLPSVNGALTPAPLDWRDVTCFSGDSWQPTQRIVGAQVPCAGLHRVATAVLPLADSPADPLGACVTAADRLGAQGSRRATAGQWLDVDGGLLVCTIAPNDPAATDPVIP